MTRNSTTPRQSMPNFEQIQTWAKELGFDQLGITDIDLAAHEDHVHRWLAAGFAGSMGYLHRNLEKRLNPSLLEQGTCRVISARMQYLPDAAEPVEILQDQSKAYISRYALGRDYHKVLRRRLAKLATQIDEALPGHRYRAFTDTAPILEKALAEKAGLGWMGKHTLLIHKDAGSWFFLGEIYTNAPLELFPSNADEADIRGSENLCGKCQACINVCPTQAIVAPNKLDATRCISYLTIEHKGVIDPELRPMMGNRIYGCDDCQLFCPWNREAATTQETDFAVRHQLDQRHLLELFAWTEDEFLIHTEGSAMRRIGYQQWQRNIAVALGNLGSEATEAKEEYRLETPSDKNSATQIFPKKKPPITTHDVAPEIIEAALEALKQRKSDAPAMVAEHITWAIDQLSRRKKLSL